MVENTTVVAFLVDFVYIFTLTIWSVFSFFTAAAAAAQRNTALRHEKVAAASLCPSDRISGEVLSCPGLQNHWKFLQELHLKHYGLVYYTRNADSGRLGHISPTLWHSEENQLTQNLGNLESKKLKMRETLNPGSQSFRQENFLIFVFLITSSMFLTQQTICQLLLLLP